MEAKKFISVLKGFRTRFTNKSNEVLEKTSVKGLCESFGGMEESEKVLKDNPDLLEYLYKVLKEPEPVKETVVEKEEKPKKETSAKKPSPKKKPSKVKEEKPVEKEKKEVEPSLENSENVVTAKNGKLYIIDTVKKTCKKVLHDLSELADSEVDLSEVNFTVYQRYLLDRFPGEGVQLKKGKLYFRGYRVSFSSESGFMIEDSTKRYAIVETDLEDIPTPKELGDWFTKPRIEHTPEELAAAVERGKVAKNPTKVETGDDEEEEEVDFEKLRKKVLRTIDGIRSKKIIGFDPEKFPEMIPFKRWKRKVNALVKDWKNRKLRYIKFLDALEVVTEEETFVVEDKNHRSSFVGAVLPKFKTVGDLVGDKITVDGKLIDAVPFLLDYILHYEPKAMQQIMRFAEGEVTDYFLLKNPFHNDWRIEYKKRSLPNTAENARILTCLCQSLYLVAPQDALYEADLQVGDRILISILDEWKTKTITTIDEGICISKGIGLTKLDKWIKLPAKEEK